MKGKIRYKPSKYNFFFDAEDGTHLAFNAMSGGFAKIRDKEWEEIQKVLRNPNNCKTEKGNRLKQSLIRGRFLIDETVDEIALLKLRNRLGRFRTDRFTFVIMPTFRCNFRCSYCYETPKKTKMAEGVKEGFLKFINEHAKYWKYLFIAWFGGEPLLEFETIKEISSELIEICKKFKCNYAASISTNGYLLSKKVIKDLVNNLQIKNFQITVDGPAEIHNKRRPLISGVGTYDRILLNLLNLANFDNVEILLRTNVDETNINYIPQFLDTLPDKLKKRVKINFQRVFHSSESSPSIKVCSTERIDPKLIIELSKTAIKKGCRIYQKFCQGLRTGFCGTDNYNYLVIGPDGLLYKCTVALNSSESIGSISNDGKLNIEIPKLAKWLGKDPFEDKECINCKVLPICMGGCTQVRIGSLSQKKGCLSEKNLVKEAVELIYLERKLIGQH